MKFVVLSVAIWVGIGSCQSQTAEIPTADGANSLGINEPIRPAIFKMDKIVSLLANKRVGIVANATSKINGTHLVDTLLSRGVNIISVFAPEHGFRGNVPDGQKIKNAMDPSSGLPVVSLYGKTKKPTREMLRDIDILVFDIQDVGVRFYTYLSTLHYVLEAAAENGKEVIVLDRPNPNGFYVDGPVLEPAYSSFIGLDPVPVVYGMTIGEYALMLNGEGWLKGGVACQLQVIECSGYTHESLHQLPVDPSPNLPDMTAIYLYPSLCFFEGTDVSVGRGTERPFTRIGEPGNRGGTFEFTPHSIPTASLYPKHEGEVCTGYDLRKTVDLDAPADSINLYWLLKMYSETDDPDEFWRADGYFDLLAGTDELRKAVVAGLTAKEIRASWQKDLEAFQKIRAKYLIYD